MVKQKDVLLILLIVIFMISLFTISWASYERGYSYGYEDANIEFEVLKEYCSQLDGFVPVIELGKNTEYKTWRNYHG